VTPRIRGRHMRCRVIDSHRRPVRYGDLLGRYVHLWGVKEGKIDISKWPTFDPTGELAGTGIKLGAVTTGPESHHFHNLL